MTRMRTLACSVCLIFVGVAPVAADTTSNAPKSLRMRPAARAPTPGAKRVAQAPTPDTPPPSGDKPPADGTGAPSAAPEPTPPPADPTAAPAPEAKPAEPPKPVAETPNLTDEELKKLS